MTTDYIALFILSYFFYRGWRKGFLRTILGPIALLACCIAAFLYYQESQNIAISFLICIIGPFALTILVSVLLKLWNKTVNDKITYSPLSRFSGGTFSLLWGGGYVVMFLLFIAFIPLKFEWFTKIQNDVTESKSYALVSQWTDNKIPATALDIGEISQAFKDPEKLKDLESTSEFKDLIEDERFKEIFTDEEIAEYIQTKNFSQLLTNPKIHALLQDKEVIDKIFAFNKKIMADGISKGNGQIP